MNIAAATADNGLAFDFGAIRTDVYRSVKRGGVLGIAGVLAMLVYLTYTWFALDVPELIARAQPERAVLLADGPELDSEDVMLGHQRMSAGAPAQISGDVITIPLDGSVSLDEAECQLIRAMLEREGGNVVATARMLGTTREKLRYRMQKHNLTGG